MRFKVIGGVVGALLLALGLWLWTPDGDRAALETKYAGPPSVFRTVVGVRLHVRDTGPKDAPAILLLHGFGSSLHTWEAWAASLSATHRVIRFDLPGAGLTGADPSGNYSDDRGIAIVEALMDTLGVAQATLVGNSLGGRIAWYFAVKHPDRVHRLLLVSPDGFASAGFEYDKAPDVPKAVALMQYMLPKAVMRASLAPAYADPTRLADSVVDRYYAMLTAPGVRTALLARLHQAILKDPVPLLRTLQMPVLLLWGEKDALIPFTNAADYQKVVPDVQLIPLPGVGHVPQEEVPTQSLEAVRSFLDG